MENTSNNKRIAKNTILLYARMFLIMGVSLYSSRIVLKTLGAEDFGIYGVVSGVVLVVGFLTTSLAGASSRFITFSLGEKDSKDNRPRCYFSTIFWIHLALATILLILSETIGLYFVKHELVIPPNRENAAFWAYQFSLFISLLAILNVPNHALIIAQERMGALASMSIVEALGKLSIALLLLKAENDRLILYSALCFLIQLIITVGYALYVRKKFPEITLGKKLFNKETFKEMFSYSIWTISGHVATLSYTQGINILLNLFFGPTINAARGIAVQVQGTTDNFVYNFQLAIRPQIIKSYASQNLSYTRQLVVASSKYGFYLTLLLIAPILLCMHSLLTIWLEDVPSHTEELLFVLLLVQLIVPLKISLVNAIQATGNIKKFQIYDSITLLSLLPIAYTLLKWFQISPQQVMFVYLSLEFVAQIIRTIIVLPQIRMNYKEYLLKVLLPCSLVLLSISIPLWFVSQLTPKDLSLIQILGVSLLCDFGIVGCIYAVGLTNTEKVFLHKQAKKVLRRG